MGEMISQDSLFQYFNDSSYYLEGYNELKFQFLKNDVIDEKLVEQQIDFYRRHKNFEKLVPLLLMTVHQHIERKDYQLATICLIESYSLLKKLDRAGSLVLYTILELSHVLEKQEQYQEAAFYCVKAIEFCYSTKEDRFLKYGLNKLGELTILSNTQKYASRFQPLFDLYENLHLSNELDACLTIERLFAKHQLVEIMTYIEKYQREHLLITEEWFDLFLQVRYIKCQYLLNQLNAIKWIDESKFEWASHGIYECYWLEYRLVQNKLKPFSEFKEFVIELHELLRNNQRWYLLDLLYENVLNDQDVLKDVQWYEKLHESAMKNKEFISKRENKMKDRLQDIHSNYKEYYRQLDALEQNSKTELVSWTQFKQLYEQNYSPSMTLISISLDRYFYQDMPQSVGSNLITHIKSLLGGDKVMAQFENMLWIYFKSHDSHVSLKKRLGRIAEQLYKQFGEKLTFLVCLPKYCKPEFEVTKERIYASFYHTMLQSPETDTYQFSCYRRGNIQYDVLKKISNILTVAKQNQNFKIYPQYFYAIDSHSVHGIEFHNDQDEYLKFADLMDGDQQWVKEILITEIELLTLNMACEYVTEHFKNYDNKPFIFIKFSRESLLNKFIVARIGNSLEALNINPSKVIIEIDETTMFEDNLQIKATINQLKKIGLNIALDEYGVGTLTGSIRNISINYLKISDQMFNQIKENTHQRHILISINKICTEQNIKMCCSNIETENTHLLISDLGVNLASGTYYQ